MRLNRAVPILFVGLIAAVLTRNTVAQESSTPEERTQWVQVTHKLESAPLDDGVNQQGETALKRLSDVHDVHVPLCPAILSEITDCRRSWCASDAAPGRVRQRLRETNFSATP